MYDICTYVIYYMYVNTSNAPTGPAPAPRHRLDKAPAALLFAQPLHRRPPPAIQGTFFFNTACVLRS